MADQQQDSEIQPLSVWLGEQRKGALDVEAGADLSKLVEAVRLTGRGGTLTVAVKVTPGKAGSLEVVDDVRLKLPEPEREAALWFADKHGRLTRHDPDQLRFTNPDTKDPI